MEKLKKSGNSRMIWRIVWVLMAGFMLAVTVSCGPGVIKGRPPFVSISDMRLQDEILSTEFTLSNQNGIEMNVDAINLTVTVDDTVLIRHDRRFDLNIDANSAENIRVETGTDATTRSLLAALDSGDRDSLPFDLTGRVHTAQDGNLDFEQKGYFYPVPGKPGHFRSAVTRARGLKREEL
jgi:hypothetical protein